MENIIEPVEGVVCGGVRSNGGSGRARGVRMEILIV